MLTISLIETYHSIQLWTREAGDAYLAIAQDLILIKIWFRFLFDSQYLSCQEEDAIFCGGNIRIVIGLLILWLRTTNTMWINFFMEISISFALVIIRWLKLLHNDKASLSQ